MKHRSMRMRLMALYLLIAIVPTVILFGSYLHYLKGSMAEDAAKTMMQTLKQVSLNIGNDLNTMRRISDLLFSNEVINKALSASESSQGTQTQLEEIRPLRQALSSAIDSANLSAIRLYVSDGKMYAREKINFFPMSDFYGNPQFDEITAKGTYLLTENNRLGLQTESSYISYVRLLKDVHRLGNTVGALFVDLDKSRLEKVLGNLEFPQECQVFLTDAGGQVLLGSPERKAVGGPWEQEGYVPKEEILYRGDMVYLIREVEQADWYLVAELPYVNLSASGMSNGMNLIVYVVGLMVLIGLILLATSLIVNGVARRVQKLASVFGAAEAGPELSPEKENSRRQVTLGIFQSLDEALGEARSLIRAGYEQMEQQRRTQLQLLQAQINPHFLYNTLDTIQWMVRTERQEDSVTIISSLTRYLRLILNNGRDVVTVKEEVEMTRAYIEIQRIRFGNSFDLEFIIEPDVYDCCLPKMTLQPVIENALLHGVRPLTQRRGRIDIDMYKEDAYLMIAVTDNGEGMDAKTRENLLALRLSREGGYGLYNVNQRILLFSGKEDSGITVESEEGKYTTVSLRIAAIKEQGSEGE